MLTLFGGFIGTLVGVTGAKVVSRLFQWPTFISSNGIAIAFVFSAAVGVFFGFYPA